MEEVDFCGCEWGAGGMQSFSVLKCPERHPLIDDMQIVNYYCDFNSKQKRNTPTSEMAPESIRNANG